MKRSFFLCLLALFFSMSFLRSTTFASDSTYGDRYDSLVESMLSRESTMKMADSLKEKLLSEAPDTDCIHLWGLLWSGEPESKCSAAMALMERIFPEGNPSRWEQVSGLILPEEMPKVLMALDGFYVALEYLMKIDRGNGLAVELLESMASSPRGRFLFLVNPPEEIAPVIIKVASSIGMIGSWTPRRLWGHLPMASPIRGYVSSDKAISEEMQFLDNGGSPSSNGPYAWDRLKGKIYRIKDPDDSIWVIRGK